MPHSASHVLTLISNPAHPLLTDAILARVQSKLGSCVADTVDHLNPGIAADLPLAEGVDIDTILSQAREALAGATIDAAIIPVAGRRKKLLVADMESTLIQQEMLDELARMAGIAEQVADITRRAMNGELDFQAALAARLALLKGMPVTALDTLAQDMTLMPGAATLMATLAAHRVPRIVVSGGFRFFTGHLARRLQLDGEHANDLPIRDGVLTGDMATPVLDRWAKRDILFQHATRLGIDVSLSAAVGDGANDVPMLEASGLGVAFRAKPSVAANARVRIDHGDLTALLYLQGYRRDELTTAPDDGP